MPQSKTIRVKGAGEPTPAVKDPHPDYGEAGGPWLAIWTPLPIPLRRQADGMLVVTDHDVRNFTRFPSKAAAQAAIDADPTLEEGKAVPMLVSDWRDSQTTAGRTRLEERKAG
jgi:hypothetical protein